MAESKIRCARPFPSLNGCMILRSFRNSAARAAKACRSRSISARPLSMALKATPAMGAIMTGLAKVVSFPPASSPVGLLDADGPRLPRPFVDRAEEMLVDVLQGFEREGRLRQVSLEDGVASRRPLVLGALKRLRIADAKLVLEGGGAGIEVGIAVRWHATRRCGPSSCRRRSGPCAHSFMIAWASGPTSPPSMRVEATPARTALVRRRCSSCETASRCSLAAVFMVSLLVGAVGASDYPPSRCNWGR